jgi:hypothetical protein
VLEGFGRPFFGGGGVRNDVEECEAEMLSGFETDLREGIGHGFIRRLSGSRSKLFTREKTGCKFFQASIYGFQEMVEHS